MGRKGGLAALFSPRSSRPASGAAAPSPPWPWPSCATKPQTASFRRHGAGAGDDDRPCCTTAGARGGSRLRPPRGKQAAAGADGDVMYKTVNSVYFDDAAGSSCRSSLFDAGGDCEEEDAVDVEEGLDDGTFSTTTAADEEWSEAVIRSLGRTSTDRLFFDAGAGPAPAPSSTNSILPASPPPFTSTTARTLAPPAEADAARKTQAPPPPKCKCPGPGLGVGVGLDCEPAGSSEQLQDDSTGSGSDDCGLLGTSSLVLEESVAVALDSADPFRDFRASMAEMVAAHGLRDWAALQEMLLWYLRINGKRNHALIVGAFVDLLVGLATSNNNVSSSSTATTATATTTTTAATPCSSSSSSSSSDSASTSGDVAAARRHTAAVATAAGPAAVEEQEQCGGGGSAGASCSSASSSSDLGLGEAAAGRGRTGIGGAIR
ncbi:hypothetical protein BS78_05G057100 [Paspalum vaginatum]|nr:hypothetical protein BS78_05G057100 [Paspalum vaginatum]